VREGKIQTYTATMTEESLAALMAAMSPESLPETGGSVFPSYAVIALLGGLIAIGGFGWKRSAGADATEAS
jgi:LPXTG-motif cell wall-anchored protein